MLKIKRQKNTLSIYLKKGFKKMHYNFFFSDPHFGHENILKFKDKEGNLIRPFSSIEEHNELIIENINKKVRIQDKLYCLGDVVIHKRNLPILDRINTKKRILLCGNHDLFGAKEYLKYFSDVRSYKMMPGEGIIFSHIPVHSSCLEGRFKYNLYGHCHANQVQDQRYFSICPEIVGYEPLELEDIKKIIKGVIY